MRILTAQTLSGADAKRLREELGLSQAEFWGAVASTQTCGCRYEREDQPIPRAVKALLIIRYIGGVKFDVSTASGVRRLTEVAKLMAAKRAART